MPIAGGHEVKGSANEEKTGHNCRGPIAGNENAVAPCLLCLLRSPNQAQLMCPRLNVTEVIHVTHMLQAANNRRLQTGKVIYHVRRRLNIQK